MKSELCPLARLAIAAWFLFQIPAYSQDVADVSLYRAGVYQQLADSEPQPIEETPSESPFILISVMEMTSDFLNDPDNLLFVRAVTMQPPTGALRSMDFFEDFSGFAYFDTFLSAAAMQSAFRAGNYRYTFGSLISGDSVFVINLPDASLPTPPRILNFVSAQTVDPTRGFNLEWTPESPAVGGVRLEVYDSADGSQVYDSGPILGSFSSLEIPANTLQPDHTYDAEITFTRFDFTDFDNSPSRSAAAAVTTRVPVKTFTGTPQTLQFVSISVNPAGEVELVIECTPNLPLNLQLADSLSGTWEIIRSFTPDSSPAKVVLSSDQLNGFALFQATQ